MTNLLYKLYRCTAPRIRATKLLNNQKTLNLIMSIRDMKSQSFLVVEHEYRNSDDPTESRYEVYNITPLTNDQLAKLLN